MPKRKKKSEKMGDRRENSETDSQRRKRVGTSEPYPKTKKRMLSIKDVPVILKKEGEEVLAIPERIEGELGKVIVQRGRRIHNKDVGGDNFQILETLVRGSKEQLITLSHDGLEKIQQELDQAKRKRRREMASVCRECMGMFVESHY